MRNFGKDAWEISGRRQISFRCSSGVVVTLHACERLAVSNCNHFMLIIAFKQLLGPAWTIEDTGDVPSQRLQAQNRLHGLTRSFFLLSWHSTKENENQMNILSHACAQAHPKLPIICLFARVFYCSWRLGNKYLWKRQPATRFPLCLSTLIEVVKISLVIESIISSTQHSAFLRMYKTQL